MTDLAKLRRRLVKPTPLPDQEKLRRFFDYDQQTGKLFHRIREPDSRNDADACKAFNRQYGGTEALAFADRRGYLHGRFEGKSYQAHRIIWKWMTGEDPDTIDHIDGDPSNNRFTNLRNCTNAENSRNYHKCTVGSSKYRGVCWVKRDQAWAARISAGDQGKISLGNYASEIEAALAYDAAARRFHGQFATLNFPGETAIAEHLK